MWGNVASVTVGSRLMYGAFAFNGAIDDIRIYIRPLSDAEISQLYVIDN